MNKLIAAESSSDGCGNLQGLDKQETPDKEMPDQDEDVLKPEVAPSQQQQAVPSNIQHERAEQVTNKLLELQQKHKEISERVQNVLIDTVDFAFGAS